MMWDQFNNGTDAASEMFGCTAGISGYTGGIGGLLQVVMMQSQVV